MQHMNSPSTLLLQGVEVPFMLELIKFFNNDIKWHNIKPPFLFFCPFHNSYSKNNKNQQNKFPSLNFGTMINMLVCDLY